MFSTFNGPFKLMFEDLKKQTIVILSITLGVVILFSISGHLFGDFTGSIFGPIYGFFLIYPFLLYNKTYKCVLSLGGTRRQYLLSTIINTVLFICINTAFLNVIYQLNLYLSENNLNPVHLQHVGLLFQSDNPVLYWWVDVVLCVFLFGVFLLVNSLWFYLGTIRILIGLTMIGGLFVVWFTNEGMGKIIDLFVNHLLSFINILGFIGLCGMALSYLIMRNGPLERGGHLVGIRSKE